MHINNFLNIFLLDILQLQATYRTPPIQRTSSLYTTTKHWLLSNTWTTNRKAQGTSITCQKYVHELHVSDIWPHAHMFYEGVTWRT